MECKNRPSTTAMRFECRIRSTESTQSPANERCRVNWLQISVEKTEQRERGRSLLNCSLWQKSRMEARFDLTRPIPCTIAVVEGWLPFVDREYARKQRRGELPVQLLSILEKKREEREASVPIKTRFASVSTRFAEQRANRPSRAILHERIYSIVLRKKERKKEEELKQRCPQLIERKLSFPQLAPRNGNSAAQRPIDGSRRGFIRL